VTAAQMEKDLAEDLRRAGYTVAGGHWVGQPPLDADVGCRSCQLPASLRQTGSESMKHTGIISRAESLQILKSDLLKAALEKHAADLAMATPEDRKEMLAQIDRGIEKESRRRMRRVEPGSLIHRGMGQTNQAPNMQIRPFRLEDEEAVVSLWRQRAGRHLLVLAPPPPRRM
jgi:hypothetical protein